MALPSLLRIEEYAGITIECGVWADAEGEAEVGTDADMDEGYGHGSVKERRNKRWAVQGGLWNGGDGIATEPRIQRFASRS